MYEINRKRKMPVFINKVGIIISLLLNILSIAYFAAYSLSIPPIANFTFALSLNRVFTGPGQKIDINTFFFFLLV